MIVDMGKLDKIVRLKKKCTHMTDHYAIRWSPISPEDIYYGDGDIGTKVWEVEAPRGNMAYMDYGGVECIMYNDRNDIAHIFRENQGPHRENTSYREIIKARFEP